MSLPGAAPSHAGGGLPPPGREAPASAEGINDPAPQSAIEPVQLGPDDRFTFRCHKGIPCFNKCCENADIMLTPYDIVRLKNRLGVTARQFIDEVTVDYAMDAHGMPGLKLAKRAGTNACAFLSKDGCAVYEDRPSACRYYALGLLAMRKKDAPSDEDSYFAVKEPHCLGHLENRTQTVREYRREQGVEQYDDMNREWRRIVLKKRSAGPAIGQPSARSLELFFLASYDVDGFRDFVSSPAFGALFDIDPAGIAASDDERLLHFAFRFLKQALFGEITIPVKAEAAAQRRARYEERQAALKSSPVAADDDGLHGGSDD